MTTPEAIMAELMALRFQLESTGIDDASMRQLWTLAATTYDMELCDSIKQHPAFGALCEYFSPRWNAYFCMKEKEHSAAIIAGKKAPVIQLSQEKHLVNYQTDIDELGIVTGRVDQGNFIHVGCGAFPESLMRAYRKFNFPRFLGLDMDAESVELACAVFPLCVTCEPGKDILFTAQNAQNFDYSQARIIFLSVAARPKRLIINRIIETMKDDAIILVRNPPRLGILLYEDCFEKKPFKDIMLVQSVEKNALVSLYAFRKACSR